MDSERRHELETNDLREFLDNFKDFWEKYGNQVLLVLILGLGGFAIYNYYTQWQTGKAEDASNQLAGATSADALQAVAGEHGRVHDEATRRFADILLGEGRTALVKDKPEDAEKALKKAGSAYTTLAQNGITTEYKLVGYEGLAQVAIMQGQWDKARANYEKMIELAGDTWLAHAERAQAGLDKLDAYRDPIAFAPEDDLSFNPGQADDEAADDGAEKAPGEDDDQPLKPVEGVLDLDLPSPLDPQGE